MITVAATAALRIRKRSVEPSSSAARKGGSGFKAKTESRTTFNGHGAARLVVISISIATRTSPTHLQYGRTSVKANDNTHGDFSAGKVGWFQASLCFLLSVLQVNLTNQPSHEIVADFPGSCEAKKFVTLRAQSG